MSSGNKEGLRARIEGVERIEAADEGLEETRGMERERDVECIQSPTWRGSSWDSEASTDADSGRPCDLFPFTLVWTRSDLSQPGRLCDKTATPQDTSTTRIVPSTYNAAQLLHHVRSIYPFEC